MPVTEERLNLAAALEALQRQTPDAPFLALGQTVFWDEPMKAGLVLAADRLGMGRKLVAGVHDTDYFAKLPSGKRQHGRFRALPHNDTTTKGLWSAAGEFSALFGSETVVTRETLLNAGLRIGTIQDSRPAFLDEATEAWGWRGIVSLDDFAPITAEVPLRQLIPELMDTLDWAIQTSLDCLVGEGKANAERLGDELRTLVCDAAEDDPGFTVADFYRKLLPQIYAFCANRDISLETTATSELLRFNPDTCRLPRFDLFAYFVNPETRDRAVAAYDEAIQGSGLYGMSRFGSGAIPFDLFIPGKGRGTIRLGRRGAVIMTPEPQFLSFRKPLRSIDELAALISEKFGDRCVVVGKAVTLIGMLAREFIFVFHEGASSYVRHSRALHQELNRQGAGLQINPILRIRYDAWSSLGVCCSWLRLPEPLQRPFGTEELCAPSFAARWKQVAQEQEHLLETLAELRRPIDLIRYLDRTLGGSWNCLAADYEQLHEGLERLRQDIEVLRAKRREIYDRIDRLKLERQEIEKAMGEHFRARIFEKQPTREDRDQRHAFASAIERIVHETAQLKMEARSLVREQEEKVTSPEIARIHERRQTIEVEATLKRLRLIREAVISARGLDKANHRPSAWWFRLVCPDGLWFWETIETAEYYLEPLV